MKKMYQYVLSQVGKKQKASGAIGYVFLFLIVLILVILTLYLGQVAKLMTHQHHVDDSLTDAVLASLVADDVYYFETYERTGTPVIRFKSVDDAHAIFIDCMRDAIADTQGFYYNFSFDSYICYEVEGTSIRITTYSGAGGTKRVTTRRVGTVRAPTGEVVSMTSAYGKVRFDIENIIDKSFITKTKDIYCTLEINN
ncbi:MAG: hypothetical protein PHT76_08550 [Anaerostipes sp.]|nr:hypothetical protein [Anaerostipes sp.]